MQLKINHGSILITGDEEGFALVSSSRLGLVISKNIDTAVSLINEGVKLGANQSNLKIIYGKNIIQKLDYFYALGTYAKG